MESAGKTGKTSRLTPALYALVVMAVLFTAFFFRAAPLDLEPVRMQNPPGVFDTTRAIERLKRVLGDETPHPVDSAALDSARERLLQEIRDLGYEPEVRDETACRSSIGGSATRCARVQNILFRTGHGTGPATILTAHYDSVDASPGAGDDGVGVAVWLEVAHHLKQMPPPRPVVFLITDGEETALLGAQAFADGNSYGIEVGRIINLEARGVRGPAMMFETSHPNEGVVSDWARGAPAPVSNSLMTAVYELLPNSTDLTIHLEEGHKGVNMAIADGLAFYHSERDSIAMLDPRSVQHMGDQALGAARYYLGTDRGDGGEIVYADVLASDLVAMPQVVGLMVLGLCFGLSALLMMKPARDMTWKRPDWRAFALPPVLLVVSGALAWAAGFLVDLIRPEPEFWAAWRQPFNCLIFLLGMLAAAAGLSWLAPNSRREALFASGWFWFLAIGVGLAFVVPGGSILSVIPGVWFVIAAFAARFWPGTARIAHGVAAVVALAIYLPLTHLFDVMMGMGVSALFGVLAFLVLSPSLAVIGPIPRQKLIPVGAVGAAALVALIVTLAAPANTRDTPLALNIVASYDMDARTAVAAAAAPPGALPKVIRDQLPGEPGVVIPGVPTLMAKRDIAFADRPAATASVVSSGDASGVRTVTLRLAAPGARFIRLRIPASAEPVGLLYGNYPRPLDLARPSGGQYVFDCFGRACDGSLLTVRLKPQTASGNESADPAQWLVQGYWTGLPADAETIAALRPDSAVKLGTGDVTVTTTRFTP